MSPYPIGTLVVFGSTLTLNDASDQGGALYVSGAKVLLGSGSTLSSNTALQGEASFLDARGVVPGAISYGLPAPVATWVPSSAYCSSDAAVFHPVQ